MKICRIPNTTCHKKIHRILFPIISLLYFFFGSFSLSISLPFWIVSRGVCSFRIGRNVRVCALDPFAITLRFHYVSLPIPERPPVSPFGMPTNVDEKRDWGCVMMTVAAPSTAAAVSPLLHGLYDAIFPIGAFFHRRPRRFSPLLLVRR